MAQMTDYFESLLLDYVLREGSYSAPSNLWIGLSNSYSGFGEGGVSSEENGSGYARVQVACNTGNWDAPASRATANTNEIAFAASSESWGTVYQVGLFDASTGGNLLMWLNFSPDPSVGNGDIIRFAAGSLIWDLKNEISTYLSHALLNHIFRGSAYSAPANVYVALGPTGAFTEAGAISEFSTAVGSYARVGVATDNDEWDAVSSGATANTNAITFPTATADWGTAVMFALFDASTSGNLLFWSNLDSSVACNNTDEPKFNAGAMTIAAA